MKFLIRLGIFLLVFVSVNSNTFGQSIIVTIAGTGTAGSSGDGGAATIATINGPNSICSDASGNIYFTDAGNHKVRRVSTAGVITTVAGTGTAGFSGDGGAAISAQLNNPSGVVVDNAGNIYVSDMFNHRIRRISTSGIISTVAGTGTAAFGGDGGALLSASFNRPYGLALDGTDILYVADQYNHVVRKIVFSSGIITTFAGSGTISGFGGDLGLATGSSARLSFPNYVFVNSTGNVFITDNGNHRVRRVNTSNIISTYAGNGTGTFAGDGLQATNASINFPAGICVDRIGNLCIADYGNHRIRTINTSGIISTIVGTGIAGGAGDGGPATAARLNLPIAICLDLNRQINIADVGNNRLRKLTANRKPLFTAGARQALTVCENSTTSINTNLAIIDTDVLQRETISVAVPALHGTVTASFSAISAGVVITPTGTTYVPTPGYVGLDSFKVRVTDSITFDTTTIVVTVNPLPNPGRITGPTAICSVGGTITLTDSVAGGVWSSNNPSVATVGTSSGIVTAVTSGMTNISYSVTNSCGTRSATYFINVGISPIITTIAGTGTAGYTGDGGLATAANFNKPHGVAIDGAGNRYVTDHQNHCIRKIDRYGIVTTIAGTGTAGFSGDGGPATAARFNLPFSAALDAAGNIYVGDPNNHRVRKISTSGIITTIAGTGTAGSLGDGGAAVSAQLNTPQGVTVDPAGNIYVAELLGHRVRKINTSGIISTFAGTGSAGATGDGGQATSATLRNPNYMFMDGVGNVCITDNGNHKIRKVNTFGVISTFAGNGTLGSGGDGGQATAANLSFPAGIAIDAYGNTYISDYGNNKVRMVLTDGTISTYVGTGTAGFLGDGGPATAARLNQAVDVSFDANGNLMVSDFNNHRVRLVSPNGCCGAPSAGTVSATATSGCTPYSSGLTLVGASATVGITYIWKTSTDGVSFSTVSGATNSFYTATVTGDVYYKCIVTCTGSGLSDSTAAIFLDYGLPTIGAVLGASTVCQGSTITLSDSTVGGGWESSNTTVAAVDSITGVVTGINAGTAIISYTLSHACGTAFALKTVTVLPLPLTPGPIIGALSPCAGNSSSLSNAVAGGIWSSSNVSVATIGTSSGLLNSVGVGTTTISYTITNSCGSASRSATATVNPQPSAITGPTSVCSGLSITLGNATTGGTWTSTSTSVATVGTSSGIVHGVSQGTAVISYTLTGGCSRATTITVHPSPGAIGGLLSVCVGATTTLTNAVSGGTWISDNPFVATIGTSTGIITGVSAGISSISYTIGGTCVVVDTVTVNPQPSAITGPASVCSGFTITLSSATTGGNWTSTNTSVASVGASSGIVRGVSQGTAVISYTLAGGCSREITIMVNRSPSAISGVLSVCAGSTSTLSNTIGFGTWASSNTGVATIGTSSGVVTGVSAGTSSITYTLSGGCTAISIVTVNPLPAAISGPVNICIGSGVTLSSATSGGTWSSGSPSVATISSTTGAISGVAVGVANISYTLAGGCFAVQSVTVNLGPSAITGTLGICTGGTTTLGNSTSGGTWTSSNTTVASIGLSSGIVNATLHGTSTITYALGGGCNALATVTVHANPASINPSGAVAICVGNNTTLSNTTTGGTWTSSNTALATISSTGVVFAVSSGSLNISYTNSAGCSSLKTITVSVTPAAITPSTSQVCIGGSVTLSNSVGGGIWTSSAPLVANAAGNIITGLNSGTATITYSIGACAAFATVTVNANPTAISPTGALALCAGSTVSLSTTSTGGTWSSSSSSVATINSTGLVFGASPGTVTLSYVLPTGCFTTKAITVNASPSLISPASASVCAGFTVTYSNAVGGGTWSSNNTGVATVAGGVATGVSAGTTTISYTIGSCFATAIVTVNPVPPAMSPSGPIVICSGSTISLSNSLSGGTWSSSMSSIASVNSSGVVNTISTGVVNISYSVAGCAALKTITVTLAPAAISPISTMVCTGLTTTLANSVSGGTWASSNTAVATVGTTGIVGGVTPGTITITYTLSSCPVYATVTVNPFPGAGIISGTASICVGSSSTLSSTVSGGRWTSSSTSVASIGSGTGIVRGIGAGTATITYTYTNPCGSASATYTVSVIAPGAGTLSGPSSVCAGTFGTFVSTVPGGTWASANTTGAISGSGVLTGISPGLDTIIYTVTNACGTSQSTKTVTIGPFLSAGSIFGASSICEGAVTTLTNPASGGVWSSSNTSIATVSSTGVVRAIAGGLDTISYTVSAACGSAIATKTVFVIALPVAGVISGPSSVCAGTVSSFTSTGIGGTWISSNASAIITGGGLLTAISPGLDTIIYRVTNSCGTATATKTLAIGSFLTAGTIAGASSVCVGSMITLSDLAPGGVWSSSNATATVGTSGVVTGVSAGIDTIQYTVTASCGSAIASKTVAVLPLPDAGSISGPGAVCIGAPVTFTNTASGGTWSTGSSAIATVSSAGLVTPVSVGSTTITYTFTNACGTARSTATIAVGPTLTAGVIAGPASVCAGASITLTNTASGGVWSSSSSVATISTMGVVTGMMEGTSVISYTATNICGTATTTAIVTVHPLPDAGSISGPSVLCIGTPVTFTNTASSGTWSVSNSTATISTVGLVTPVSAGTNTISYTSTTVCGTAVATLAVAVGTTASAATISGPTNVCIGASISLSASLPGGAWSIAGGGVTISSGGVVTGLSSGTASITYTMSGSCGSASATHTVVVSPAPDAGVISGVSVLCIGSPAIYTNTASGGTWSMANTTATITTGGIVTPVSSGSNTVSYTAVTGCGTSIATMPVTISTGASAGTLSGPGNVCAGSTVTVTSTAGGGVWSASNSNATVGTASGIVTGLTPGLDTIIYTVSSSCGTAIATTTIAVNLTPVAGTISGPTSICASSFYSYTNSATGGAWSTSDASLATISSAGTLTAIASGALTISYTVTNGCGTAIATQAVSIGSALTAGAIAGASGICTGTTALLTNSASGGVWSSSNPSVATVSGSGLVLGTGTGTATISYTVSGSCGTIAATHVVAVSPAPDAGIITGISILCSGTFTTFTNFATGGAWTTASAGAISNITSGGLLTAVTPGADTVFYTVTNSCGTSRASKPITVTTPISAGTIAGPAIVCAGSLSTYTATVAGGTWSSSNTSIATIGGSSGVLRGIAPGSATVTYMVSGGCGAVVTTATLTVNSSASAGTISGPSSICAGSVIAYTASIAGGAWSSSNTAVASVNSAGMVAGVTPGLVVLSYTVTDACGTAHATLPVTVGVPPSLGPIAGATSVCQGSGILLTNATTGGVWSSSNTTIASVGTGSGFVSGLLPGVATISYTTVGTCGTVSVAQAITVVPLPSASSLTGPDTVCVSGTVMLSSTIPGGAWSSSNSNAAVSGGLVTGLSTGTTTISYVVSNACGAAIVTKSMVIANTPAPATVSGSSNVCVGSGITLLASLPGGAWSTANGNAAIAGPGIITGVLVGMDTVFYSMTNACGTTVTPKIMSVNPLPVVPAISGPSMQCIGTTVTLANALTGGIWNSSNPAVASIGLSSGITTAYTVGTTTITYTATNSFGCPASVTMIDTVVVAPVLPAITGPTSVCTGASVTLANATAGGSWSSSNSAIASIHPVTGVVTGVSFGSVAMSYTIVNTCGTAVVIRMLTVHPLPAVGAIAGPLQVCQGASITLTSATTGGVWGSSLPTVASVGATSGVVMGIGTGIATITYTVTSSAGCTAAAVRSVSVNAAPALSAITGVTNQCIGASTLLSNSTPGGTWASTNSAIASVGTASGIVSGVSPGVVAIIYSVTNVGGCTSAVTTADTVHALPSVAAITGPADVCISSLATLSNATAGGTWSSSNTSVATIHPVTGVVSAISVGTTTIIYSVTVGTGCTSWVTMVLSVRPLPTISPITGPADVCVGNAVTLSSATAGGMWSSSDTTIATVGAASGRVTGVAPGSLFIRYTYTGTYGCTASIASLFSVRALPVVAAITGAGTQCVGSTATVASATAGGVWSSSNTAVATIDAASGLVTGVAAGTSLISYAVLGSGGCTGWVTAIHSVLAPPAPGTITGTTALCVGAVVTLSNTAGGTWNSSDATVATIGSVSGAVTGLAAGTVRIYTTRSNACGTVTDSASLTVNPLPIVPAITGATAVFCAGTSITLSNATSGGAWGSSNTAIATVGATTGIVTGVAVGTVNIAYRITSSTGCVGTANISLTVGAAAPTGSITPGGSATLCQGNPVLLTAVATGAVGYQWSRNTAVITGATNATYIATVPGIYAVVVTNGTCSRTLAGVNVVAGPNAVIAFTPPNILSTGMFAAYQWYKNGLVITGATTSSTTTIGPGNYTVVVTDANGCRDTSAAYVVAGGPGTGVGNVGEEEVSIYPNPATDVLHVSAPTTVTIELLTIDGKWIRQQEYTNEISVQGLANGVYMVRIYNSEHVLLKTARFTKNE